MCRDCGGSQFCDHNRRKCLCRECGGVSICEHNKERTKCRDCKGGSLCEHDKIKSNCRECGGLSFCKHGRRKTHCKLCGGSQLCKTPLCETRGTKKYNGYCMPCCIHMCPEITVSRNYKTKEREVSDKIKESFPDFKWVLDKRVEGGCSKRRPDLLLDLETHIIIIEVDENKHTTYDCSCENKRLMEISRDLDHRPIVFIRFNPDGYVDSTGKKISSCWKVNGNGVMTIMKTRQKEWDNRISTLKDQVKYWVENSTEKTVEIIELFY